VVEQNDALTTAGHSGRRHGFYIPVLAESTQQRTTRSAISGGRGRCGTAPRNEPWSVSRDEHGGRSTVSTLAWCQAVSVIGRSTQLIRSRSFLPVTSIGCSAFCLRSPSSSLLPPSTLSTSRLTKVPSWISVSSCFIRSLVPASITRGPDR